MKIQTTPGGEELKYFRISFVYEKKDVQKIVLLKS